MDANPFAWSVPPAPPSQVSPADKSASALPATDLALAQVQPWLDYVTDVEAMRPLTQFWLIQPEVSMTDYMDQAGAVPLVNQYTDVPNPPQASVAQAQSDAMLQMIQDYLPGVP